MDKNKLIYERKIIMEQITNLTTNIRAIDNIKSEVLCEVARLYRELADFDDENLYENVSGSIATIIALDYILARRMGLQFSDVDTKIVELTAIAAESDHELEKAFGDMTDLENYVKKRIREM